jgi:hypothetical protein
VGTVRQLNSRVNATTVAQPSGGVGALGPEEFLDLQVILGHAAEGQCAPSDFTESGDRFPGFAKCDRLGHESHYLLRLVP